MSNTQDWTPDQRERKALVEAGRTVVASRRNDGTRKPRDAALIAWAKEKGLVQPIYRGTPWGNPYRIGGDGTRNEVIALYKSRHLPGNAKLMSNISKLKGKVLLCWCYPEPCHGDVLAAEANKCKEERLIPG